MTTENAIFPAGCSTKGETGVNIRSTMADPMKPLKRYSSFFTWRFKIKAVNKSKRESKQKFNSQMTSR